MIFNQIRITKNLPNRSIRLITSCIIVLCTTVACSVRPANLHLSSFESGVGPSYKSGVYSLLDDVGTFNQSNALAFDLQQEGLFREMKQRKFYEKPSIKRKRKEKEAQRRLRKKMRAIKRFN